MDRNDLVGPLPAEFGLLRRLGKSDVLKKLQQWIRLDAGHVC